MVIQGQYIELIEVVSVVPVGNMDKCRVAFTSGSKELFTGYQELMKALAKE